MKLMLLASGIFMVLAVNAYAQKTGDFCGTVFDKSWETPEFDEARYRDYSMAKTTATPYYIPVVFHVIHAGGPENVADTFIQRVFNELNSKFSNTSSYHVSDGLNTGIQFCLAQNDPMGNPTTGITHDSDLATFMQTYHTAMSLPAGFDVDSLIKRRYNWDPAHYLNIYTVYVAHLGGQTYGGYATLPSSRGGFKDGIVLGYKYINPAEPLHYRYDVVAHEAGHYLGLYHTFQFGCNCSNCMVTGDCVCDTPPDDYSNILDTLCFYNSCLTDADDTAVHNPFRSPSLGGLGDQFDDTRNFMDYSHCSAKFTAGQRTRMIAALTVTRHSLFDSLATSAICSIPSLGTADINAANVIVAPNPFTDEIRVSAPAHGHYSITLMDLYGRIVVNGDFDGVSGSISVAHLPAGLYVYRIRDEYGAAKTGKVVKQY